MQTSCGTWKFWGMLSDDDGKSSANTCLAARSFLEGKKNDIHVIASNQAVPCPGVGAQVGCGHPLLHKVHVTHTMHGTQPTLKCSQCGGRLAAGCAKVVSRKLLFPCGTPQARVCTGVEADLCLEKKRLRATEPAWDTACVMCS